MADWDTEKTKTNGTHHGEPTTNGGEAKIEIDFGMIQGTKAKRVKALHLDERFMKTDLDGVRTPRELRRIFTELKETIGEQLDSIHVNLDQTVITGSNLAMVVGPQLTNVSVESGLSFHNQPDREAFGRSIYQHESLSEIFLHNLQIREGVVARWSKNPPPPLDILVPAFSSILFLNKLELSGLSITSPDPTKPMVSLPGVKELCKSLTLERLELSRLGLTDDHFGVIAEQISQNSSTCLRELVLNDNSNSEYGIAMMATLLDKPECPLEHLEFHQDDLVVDGETLDMIMGAVKNNTRIKNLKIHLWGDDDGEQATTKAAKELEFYLRLNRIDRKKLITPTTTRKEWIEVVEAARNEPDLLFYTLRNSSFWWKHRMMIRSRDPKEATATISPLVSPSGSHSRTPASGGRRRKSSARMRMLKERHSEVIGGLNIDINLDDDDDLSDIGEDEVAEGKLIDFQKELKEKNLPLTIDWNGNLDQESVHSRMSNISLGDQTYIQDLMNQREKLGDHIRQEILEDALEELDFAVENDKLLPGMSEEYYLSRVFMRLEAERKKESRAREEKLESLLEKELIKAVAKENADKAEKEKAATKDDTKGGASGGGKEGSKEGDTAEGK